MESDHTGKGEQQSGTDRQLHDELRRMEHAHTYKMERLKLAHEQEMERLRLQFAHELELAKLRAGRKYRPNEGPVGSARQAPHERRARQERSPTESRAQRVLADLATAESIRDHAEWRYSAGEIDEDAYHRQLKIRDDLLKKALERA
jgi:hypothetical protein